eukprot:COSAG01_NODE_4778_length_4749_cov_231.390108_1_plen_119_part_00
MVPRAFGALGDCTDGSSVPLPPQRVPLPRLRLAKGVLGLLSILLNVFTLSRAWVRVPVAISELPLALSEEWRKFAAPPPEHVEPTVSGWFHHHTDQWLGKHPDGRCGVRCVLFGVRFD